MFTFQSRRARLSAVRPIKGTINSAQRCNLCVIFTVDITILAFHFNPTHPFNHTRIWNAHQRNGKKAKKEMKNIFTVNNPKKENGKVRNYFSRGEAGNGKEFYSLGLSDGSPFSVCWIEWKMPDKPSAREEWIPPPLTYNFLQYSYRVHRATCNVKYNRKMKWRGKKE